MAPAPAATAMAASSAMVTPQILTSSGISAGQRLQRGGRVRRAHQRLADQHRVDAGRPQPRDVGGVRIPDSATMIRSAGTRGRMRVASSRSTVNVRRSRLLMPTIVAPASTARATSVSSCASTSASSPAAAAAASSARELAVGQRRDNQQHRIGAGRSRLDDLVAVDDEVLAQERQRARAARAAARSARLPPKNGPSVSTDIARAPPAA